MCSIGIGDLQYVRKEGSLEVLVVNRQVHLTFPNESTIDALRHWLLEAKLGKHLDARLDCQSVDISALTP